MGNSPCNILLEFKTEFTYLTNQNNEDELLVRKVNRKGKQFNEDSEFADLFYPDRKEPYTLEYDQSVLTAGVDIPGFMDSLKTQFKNLGLDPEKASENDINLNLKKAPSASKAEDGEYYGPDTPLNQDMDNDQEDGNIFNKFLRK